MLSAVADAAVATTATTAAAPLAASSALDRLRGTVCAVVFCSRYVDLFWNFSSMYNWFLKVLFIGCSSAIVYFMRFGAPQQATYNPDLDAFPVQYLLGPCALAGMLINQDHYSVFEMVWAFSIYLEAVAILPQLFLLQKQGEVENLTSHYVAALGAYRALYLINWIYRYVTEDDYLQRLVWFAGLVQVWSLGRSRSAVAWLARLCAVPRIRPPASRPADGARAPQPCPPITRRPPAPQRRPASTATSSTTTTRASAAA